MATRKRLKLPKTELFQVTTGYFCAGIVVKNGRVVEAAPILRWSIGKPIGAVVAWAESKGGEVTGGWGT